MGKPSRQAVMKVSRQLLEQLLPQYETVLRCGVAVSESLWEGPVLRSGVALAREQSLQPWSEVVKPFHDALKLPADCRITGISAGHEHWFNRDQIAFRVESPDFVEVPEGNVLPNVDAVYQRAGYEPNAVYADGKDPNTCGNGYFLRWDGPAVETPRTYGPDGKEVSAGTSSQQATFQCIEFDADDLKLSSDPDKVPQPNPFVRVFTERSLESLPANPEAVVKTGGYPPPEGSEAFLKELEEKGVLEGRPTRLFPSPCWRCGSPTIRCLPDGSAECQGCATKSLL